MGQCDEGICMIRCRKLRMILTTTNKSTMATTTTMMTMITMIPPSAPTDYSLPTVFCNVMLQFGNSFLHSFIHSFFHSIIHSFLHSFIHSFILPFIHSFILPFLHSFIPSFFHSSIHLSFSFRVIIPSRNFSVGLHRHRLHHEVAQMGFGQVLVLREGEAELHSTQQQLPEAVKDVRRHSRRQPASG